MDISFFTHVNSSLTANGFGTAGYNIVTSLHKLGHNVAFNNPHAPVELQFTQPSDARKIPGQHGVLYTPWESTALKEEWFGKMDITDSFWTTSDWCKEIFENNGRQVDYVYQHGVSDIWSVRRRRLGSKIRFLHIGADAPRKSAQMVFDAFVELFANNPRYHLTIKSISPTSVRYDRPGVGVVHPTFFSNVTVIDEEYDEDQMVALMHQNHVLIYPSWGEGFGLIPLQALATGMPVIFNMTWAPYRKYSVGLDVSDRLVDSPWPYMHPGKMLKPSYEDVKTQMLAAAENYDLYSTRALYQAKEIHEEYSWLNVTDKAVQKMCDYL